MVDKKYLPYLMDSFYQVHPSGKGSGLGLAIAKKLIELHGGRLTITSQDHKTVATIVLPKMQTAKDFGQVIFKNCLFLLMNWASWLRLPIVRRILLIQATRG